MRTSLWASTRYRAFRSVDKAAASSLVSSQTEICDFLTDFERIKISEVMTKEESYYCSCRNYSRASAQEILRRHKIEKLPIVDARGRISRDLSLSRISKSRFSTPTPPVIQEADSSAAQESALLQTFSKGQRLLSTLRSMFSFLTRHTVTVQTLSNVSK